MTATFTAISKEYVTLGKSFQYVSGAPGLAYNAFVDEIARDAYFDFEQEQPSTLGRTSARNEDDNLRAIAVWSDLGSVPKLEESVSFKSGSWGGPLKTSLMTV